MVKAFHLHIYGNPVDLEALTVERKFLPTCRPLEVILNTRLNVSLGQLSGTQDAGYPGTISFVLFEGSVNRAIGEMNDVEARSTRRSPRLRLQVPVFVRGTDASGSEFIELTKTLDISALGACITCEHVLRANQKIHLTIPAPSPLSASSFPNATPPILARVLRQNRVGDARLFGIEFFQPLE